MKRLFTAASKALILLLFLVPASCREAAETAVPKLIAQLKSKDAHQRSLAAQGLAAYGKEAEPAVKPLINVLWDQNNGVRSAAALALGAIDTPQARQAIDFYKREKERQNQAAGGVTEKK